MCFFGRYCGYGAILVHIVTGIVGYQFDVDNVILYKDVAAQEQPRGSYFGYSVALSNMSSEDSSILIGAPRANSTSYENINEPGTVFKCEIGKPCKEWVIYSEEDHIPQNNSWLGGTLNVENQAGTDIVLVCAPRWLNTDEVFWLLSGMCYQAEVDSQPTDEKKLEPLKDTLSIYDTHLYFAMGQSGFSTAIIPAEDSFIQYVLGCPGVYIGHGTPIRSKFDKFEKDFVIPNPSKDLSVGGNAYSGYAVTTGLYFGGSKRVYATGAPRARGLRGQVILFYFPDIARDGKDGGIEQITNVHGNQVGEYFGSALASCDVDGDGSDDLLVGAPQWSKNSDEGRIYIFRGKGTKNKLANKQVIDGAKVQGRFGSSITCLGDIDYDGYADVAVGAPYDGNGTVYIYHGSKDGLKPTQQISAPKNTKGFGISISTPKDIDNNGHADIAVGAYLSGHVALFRSKRVVNMTVTLSSNLSEKGLERDAESFTVIVCSSYTGIYAPQELNVTKKLVINDVHQRAEINIKGNSLITYEFNDTITMKLNPKCQNFNITIRKTNDYFLAPLKLSVTQRLNTINNHGTLLVKENITGVEYFNNSHAITNAAHQEVRSPLDVWFALDCGNKSICNSNLSIHMTTDLQNVTHYVIGSMPYIKLTIVVTNTGDDAYHAQAVVSMPMFIQLHSKPPSCTTTEMGNIICDLDNPLGRNKTKNVTLELDVSNLPRDTKQFQLNAIAETKSTDAASGNHETSLSIDCVTATDIGIAGKADTNSYPYSLKGEKEQLQIITFEHTYEVKNYEVTPITEALLSVSFPTHWIKTGNEIEVVKENKITGTLDGREFECTNTENNMKIAASTHDAFTMTRQSNDSSSSSRSVSQAKKNFAVDSGKTFNVPLDNRTLYVNCTNPSFKWKTINCELGSFTSARSVAKLILTFDLLLQNFTPEMIGKKDIVFFVSNASASITQSINNRPDSMLIGTMFIRSLPEDQLPPWIIPLSVFVGILLLILVVLGLMKFGFFKRSKKIELEESIMNRDTVYPKILLDTTPSNKPLEIM